MNNLWCVQWTMGRQHNMTTSVTRNKSIKSIKVDQKWFHQKNDRFWHIYKNCLRMWEIWVKLIVPKGFEKSNKSTNLVSPTTTHLPASKVKIIFLQFAFSVLWRIRRSLKLEAKQIRDKKLIYGLSQNVICLVIKWHFLLFRNFWLDEKEREELIRKDIFWWWRRSIRFWAKIKASKKFWQRSEQ